MNLSHGNGTDHFCCVESQAFRADFISAVCYPILLVLCTVGNILNITVFVKQQVFHSKEILVLSLAVSDLLLMWFMFPKYLTHHFDLFDTPITEFLQENSHIFSFLQDTFYYTSDSILVLFSLERLIVFRHRHFYVKWKKTGRAVTFVVIVWLICAVANSWTLVHGYVWRQRENRDEYVPPKWLSDWDVVHRQFEIIFPLLVALSLFVINTLLVKHIEKGIRNGSQLRRHSRFTLSTGLNNSSDSSKILGDGIYAMLLGCVVVYFVTQLPSITINTLQYFSFFAYSQISFLHPIVWTISLINYSMNFAVYSLTSKKYVALARGLCIPVYQRPPCGDEH